MFQITLVPEGRGEFAQFSTRQDTRPLSETLADATVEWPATTMDDEWTSDLQAVRAEIRV
jgi:hypothetical protein